MKIEIPKGMTGPQLAEWLEHNSDVQSDETYFRTFTQPELDDARRQHAELSMRLEDRNKEFAEAKKEHGNITKTIGKDIADTLKAVRARGIQETGKCYTFRDTEHMTVTTYNRFGTIINHRSMTPEERQLSIDEGSGVRQLRAVNQ